MSKEKQIEEMDADITTWFRENFYEVGRLSNYLYNNGYRKQSEPISCGHEKGGEWVLLRGAEDKLVCIQKQYLTPFEKLKELELYGRVSANGTVYVAVKIGCILRGVILTYRPSGEKFVETMGAIYNAAAVALAAERDEAEQMRV